jgi:hypothetical protein
MEEKLSKNEAMLHLIWLLACADKEDESYLKKIFNTVIDKAGATEYIELFGYSANNPFVSKEENDFLDSVRNIEKINLSWDDFNATRTRLKNKKTIISECLKVINRCGLEFKKKVLRYMISMGFATKENKDKLSDNEWALICQIQDVLGISDDERDSVYFSIK